MTFQGSTIGDRLDAGRLRSPDLSSTNSTFPFGDQAGLDASSKFNQRLSFQETRSSPHRRFNTNNLPMSNTLSPIGQPRRQQPETSIPDPNLAVSLARIYRSSASQKPIASRHSVAFCHMTTECFANLYIGRSITRFNL